jgi:hypothetical protein
MSYESLNNLEKSVIFRETFNSSFDVQNNKYGGGTISSNISFQNGSASLKPASNIVYSIKRIPRVHSFRVIMTLGAFGGFTAGNGGHQWWLQIVNSTSISNSPFNSSVTFTLTKGLQLNTKYEFVLIQDATNQYLYVNGISQGVLSTSYSTNLGFKCINESGIGANDGGLRKYELLEFYDRVLTATEIKLLYQQCLYKESTELPLLLDYDSTRGIVEDKTGKNTVTLTNTSIKRVGKVYSTYFSTQGSFASVSLNDAVRIPNVVWSIWVKLDCDTLNRSHYIRINGVSIQFDSQDFRYFPTGGAGIINPPKTIKYNNFVIFGEPVNSKLYLNGIFISNAGAWSCTGNSNLVIGDGDIGSKGIFITKVQIFAGKVSNRDVFATQLYNSQKGQFGL